MVQLPRVSFFLFKELQQTQKVLLRVLPLRVGVDSNNWFVLA